MVSSKNKYYFIPKPYSNIMYILKNTNTLWKHMKMNNFLIYFKNVIIELQNRIFYNELLFII